MCIVLLSMRETISRTEIGNLFALLKVIITLNVFLTGSDDDV
jgi:hypothetical protein